MLCMIRYQEDPPEDAHEDEQDPKSTDEENPWKKAKAVSRHRTSGQDPEHPDLEIYTSGLGRSSEACSSGWLLFPWL